MKYADNTKRRGIVNTKKQQEIMQNELNDLVNWNHINGMKFNNTKCKITHVEANKKHFLLRAKRVKSHQVQAAAKTTDPNTDCLRFTSFLASLWKGQMLTKRQYGVKRESQLSMFPQSKPLSFVSKCYFVSHCH